jgi:hypothetical protein
MKLAIQVCGWLVGLPLEILILSALLRGSYRRFPFVFAYTLASFLATLLEIYQSLSARSGSPGGLRELAQTYWICEAILLPLLLWVVLNLIWHASEGIERRRAVRVTLASAAILVPVISLLIHFNSHPASVGEWMTPWARDLNFCSAILDLSLWALLIFSREKDMRLLMLSGALGIQFTGEAIGGSIRNFAIAAYHGPTPRAKALLMVGNVIIMLANLTCLYIWRQTFRRGGSPAPDVSKPAAAAGTTAT